MKLRLVLKSYFLLRPFLNVDILQGSLLGIILTLQILKNFIYSHSFSDYLHVNDSQIYISSLALSPNFQTVLSGCL